MAQNETLGLYPHSTPSGEVIPYDIIRPLGITRKDFTDIASGLIAIPSNADILALFATEDCIISFAATAVAPVDGTFVANCMVVPARTYVNIDHNAATTFSVIGIVGPGTLFVTAVQKWNDTKKFSQYQRG